MDFKKLFVDDVKLDWINRARGVPGMQQRVEELGNLQYSIMENLESRFGSEGAMVVMMFQLQAALKILKACESAEGNEIALHDWNLKIRQVLDKFRCMEGKASGVMTNEEK